MSEWDTFESILASLHEAVLDPDGWPGASGMIDEFLDTIPPNVKPVREQKMKLSKIFS